MIEFIMNMSNEDLNYEINILHSLDYSKLSLYTVQCYTELLRQLKKEQIRRMKGET